MSNAAAVAKFQRALDKHAERIPSQALAFQKRVAFMLLGAAYKDAEGRVRLIVGLLQLTPVLTGRARGNYQVTTGSPATGTLDDARFGGATGAGATAEETSRAAAALANARPYGVIFIVNNLPYIVVPLNDGGKNRQAHHMMERAIANTRAALAGRAA